MDKLSEELKEQVKSERRFLHDISNHILVAHGMASLVQRALQDNPNVNATELDRLEKSIDALRKLTDELQARRKILYSI